ncbi:unnamed protein product [Calypogeia fissa]
MGATMDQRNQEGAPRNGANFDAPNSGEGYGSIPLQAEWRRNSNEYYAGNDSLYQPGHTPTAPAAVNHGLEDPPHYGQSHTPAYRTFAEPPNSLQQNSLAGTRALAEQLVVVTPLVRQQSENLGDGKDDTNMTRADTPENSDVEMAGIDKNELVRFRLWEKQGGRKQGERSPGTPSHHQKASPVNKKNWKSTGDLFPAPSDVNTNWHSRVIEQESDPAVLTGIAEGNEMQVDEERLSNSQSTDRIDLGTPGRRGEETKTPTTQQTRKTPSRQ